MSFSIRFLDLPLQYLGENPAIPSAIGEICIGDFREEFASSLYTWSKSDYELQWKRAINHILRGNSKAALIDEFIDPHESDHLVWWPLYRVGETIYVHQQLLFFQNGPVPFLKLSEPFSLERQFDYVRDRETTDENGNLVSEWSVDIGEFENFASTLT